ncbi:MAG: hypothetical protein QOH37_2937 [Nocardioidaceae bacterium]|nr:hypothetical protein [Nocardioidaceae bacterium]
MTQESSDQQASSPDEGGVVSIPDDQLPEDLKPTEDNPLAQPADDDVPDDLVTQGFGPAGSGGNSADASDSGNDDASDTSSSEASSELTDEGGDGSQA